MRRGLWQFGWMIGVALLLSACKNVTVAPPDQSFYTPSWCLPHCSWGGGGV